MVSVSGPDSVHFLQNLITSNVERVHPGSGGYGALLTPQGKVQFDFLVYSVDDGFLFDIPRLSTTEFVRRLGFYRLRAAVEITDLSDERSIVAEWGSEKNVILSDPAVRDPRLSALGYRAVVDAESVLPDTVNEVDLAAYHRYRIALGVPEGTVDFAYGDVFPHDADIDQLGGIDFSKGCYVGQEIVSRMEHRGTARRRIIQLRGEADLRSGADIDAGDRVIGSVGSVAGTQGLGLIRIDRAAEANEAGIPIRSDSNPLELNIPDWAQFKWRDVRAS